MIVLRCITKGVEFLSYISEVSLKERYGQLFSFEVSLEEADFSHIVPRKCQTTVVQFKQNLIGVHQKMRYVTVSFV